MSNELLASKMVLEEEEPAVRQIQPVATAVLCVAGVTERGPHERTLVSSPEDYQRIFGGYTALGQAKQAMDGYFTNGGVQAYVKRVVHFTDVSNPATKTSAAATLNLLSQATAPYAGAVTCASSEPYNLEPAQTLVVKVDGGGNQTVTFDAAAPSVECVNAEPYALSDGQTLTVKIDQGSVQTVIFNTSEFANIAAATAEEVAAVVNAELTGGYALVTSGGAKVTIKSDKRGTGGYVQVTGGTANAALGFSTSEVQGTGDVANIDAVTATEGATRVNADTTGCTAAVVGGKVRITSDTTGASSSVQVTSASTATAFGFDNAVHSGGTGTAANTLRVDAKTDGSYGNDLRVVVAAATSGDSDEFNLQVEEDGVVVEVWPNLSMTDGEDNYAETVVNNADTGSNLVAVTDLDAALPSPYDVPATGTFGPLTGGNDGLSGIADTDFVGHAAGETGFRGFDDVQDGTLLACPDRPTAAVHNAMLTYCEVTRGKAMFAILDPPASESAAGIVTYVKTTAALLNASEFGAIYWPQVKVLNPNKAVFGSDAEITIPPSGHIAGVFARTDAGQSGGVFQPPAGIERGVLLGITGFETDEVKKEAKRDLVYPKRINPLTVYPGAPRHIDGTRTLKGNGNFPSVSERRGAIFIEQSLLGGLQFARHSNNTEELRARCDRSATAFLLIQMNNGAFRTRNPATAFFVDFGDGLNPPSVQFAGKLVGRVGLATNKPTDWVILRVSQDTRALEEEIAAATA